MRVLDLFTGTGSVAKVAREMGCEVITLDIDAKCKPDLCTNILEFDYRAYPINYFDVIWASPDCRTFSQARRSNLGRVINGELCTAETLLRDVSNIGLPILRRTEEIIDYLKPRAYFIENPATGSMKDYIANRDVYTFDYCMYGFPYRKRTHIWSNIKLSSLLCDGSHMIDNKHIMTAIGSSKSQKGQGGGASKRERYAIPNKLITYLLDQALLNVD